MFTGLSGEQPDAPMMSGRWTWGLAGAAPGDTRSPAQERVQSWPGQGCPASRWEGPAGPGLGCDFPHHPLQTGVLGPLPRHLASPAWAAQRPQAFCEQGHCSARQGPPRHVPSHFTDSSAQGALGTLGLFQEGDLLPETCHPRAWLAFSSERPPTCSPWPGPPGKTTCQWPVGLWCQHLKQVLLQKPSLLNL